jgi:hypothetical protein
MNLLKFAIGLCAGTLVSVSAFAASTGAVGTHKGSIRPPKASGSAMVCVSSATRMVGQEVVVGESKAADCGDQMKVMTSDKAKSQHRGASAW